MGLNSKAQQIYELLIKNWDNKKQEIDQSIDLAKEQMLQTHTIPLNRMGLQQKTIWTNVNNTEAAIYEQERKREYLISGLLYAANAWNTSGVSSETLAAVDHFFTTHIIDMLKSLKHDDFSLIEQINMLRMSIIKMEKI